MTERDLPSRADVGRALPNQDELKSKAVGVVLGCSFNIDLRRMFRGSRTIFSHEIQNAMDDGTLPVVDFGEAGKWLPHWALRSTIDEQGYYIEESVALLWERARSQGVPPMSFVNAMASVDPENPDAGSRIDILLLGRPDSFSILSGVVDKIIARPIGE